MLSRETVGGMNTKKALPDSAPLSADDLDPSTLRMLIEVEGHSGERVSAAIFPIALEDNAVVGAVEWYCAELWASIVRVDFETPPEAPHLLLIWTALGDDAVHAVPCLAATKWLKVKLSLPPDWGVSARGVLIEVDARTWCAVLRFTDDGTTLAVDVPLSFREKSVGDVLAEMCAYFFLHFRFTSLDTALSLAAARERT